MERLTLHSLDFNTEPHERFYVLTFMCLDTGNTIIINTDKIRHRLRDIVSSEFLNELYVELPNYYENQQTKTTLQRLH